MYFELFVVINSYLINGVLVFATGSLLGSFLNVVIYRIPREKSIAFPGSKCPKCNTPIAWYDNIPVVSWVLLGAKCRYCKEPISIRYPSVELITAILFLLAFMTLGANWNWFFIAYFICLMVVITWIDIDHMLILDNITYPGILIGFLYNFIKGDIIQSLIGAFLGFLFFYMITKISLIVLKKEGMGMGDVVLATLLGSWLGLNSLIGTVFLSFVIGSLVGIFLLIKNRKSEYFPFGPALAFSALVTLISKNYIFDWYVNKILL